MKKFTHTDGTGFVCDGIGICVGVEIVRAFMREFAVGLLIGTVACVLIAAIVAFFILVI